MNEQNRNRHIRPFLDSQLKNAALYARIYAIVNQISRGQVASYGQVAEIEGNCDARIVGYAMSSLNSDSEVPWHRVINSQGKISVRGSGYGSELQRQLLEEEGVRFDSQDKVDFDIFGWRRPDKEFNYTLDGFTDL